MPSNPFDNATQPTAGQHLVPGLYEGQVGLDRPSRKALGRLVLAGDDRLMVGELALDSL
jgi:hypothetical protein